MDIKSRFEFKTKQLFLFQLSILTPVIFGCTNNYPEPSIDPRPTPFQSTSTPLHQKSTSSATIASLTPEIKVTPLPTMFPEEAIEIVNELEETNGDCKFPCWWGLEMGSATIQEVNDLVSPLKTNINYSTSELYDFISILYAKQVNDFGEIETGYTVFTFSNDILVKSYSFFYDKNSSLPVMLNDYGTPGEIWIWARYLFEDDRLMSIELYYPDQGIFANFNYDITLADILPNGNTLACFDYPENLMLWWPKLENPINVVRPLHTDPELAEYYIPLREALGIDRETFYEMYKGAEDEVCIEFPKEIWGGQGP